MALSRSRLLAHPLSLSLLTATLATFAAYASAPDVTPPGPSVDRAPRPIRLAKKVKDVDLSQQFSHDTHLAEPKVGEKLTCKSCHEGSVSDEGQCIEQKAPWPKHKSCSRCHTNFYLPPLGACTKCHERADIRPGNPLRELKREQVTPRKVRFNHKLHLSPTEKVAKAEGAVSCKVCHKVKRKGAVGQPSHAQCCECHNKADIAVKMTDCGSCHFNKVQVKRPKSIIHSFTHNKKTHLRNPDGKPRTCVSCHTDGASATTLATIQTPAMNPCLDCHNGKDAFDVSSDCFKCHIDGGQGMPLPKSHPAPAATKSTK